MYRSLKHISLLLTIFLFISLPTAAGEEADLLIKENMLRQQIISFLQSGRSLDQLPASHPLYPMRDTPCLALVSYYLMQHDTGMLERFFPKIVPHVIERFSSSRTTRSGLLTGTAGDAEGAEIYLSPYLNGLANIEIYTLYLIASRIGMNTRALGYLDWSRELSATINRTFYNYNRNYYFPLDSGGHYLFVHLPQQLVPLVMNRRMDCESKLNIFGNCTAAVDNELLPGSLDLYRGSLFHHRLINDLLGGISCVGVSASL
ncbi:MAG: hypothetical protein GF417_06420, partial [Candidatus Latescibacteria bacterium]|nr:hypothetical protein [bacterium]MBD3424052.1 hypothetical protein [Candidatus Latescibacterota bacterium]